MVSEKKIRTDRINCVIVEDDPVSLFMVKQLVDKTSFLNLQESFTDSLEASRYLRDNRVELLFLDIEMPGLNGFDLIKLLDYSPSIIIITSNKQYAAEAFDYDVHDFLVKPVLDYSRFLKAVYGLEETHTKSMQERTSNVFVKADSVLHNLEVDNILFIEAFGDYVKIHTSKKVLMVLSTLKSFEGKIPVEQFVRVHRSYIVNIKKIDNIDPNNLQIGTKIIPVSATLRDDLLNKIKLL